MTQLLERDEARAMARNDDDEAPARPGPPPRPRRGGSAPPNRTGTRATPPPPPPRKPPPKTRAGGRRDDDDDDDDRPLPPRKKGGSGVWTVLFIVGGVLGLFALGGCGVLGVIFFGAYSIGQQASKKHDEFVKDNNLAPASTLDEALAALGPGNKPGRKLGGLQFLQTMPPDPAHKKEITTAVTEVLNRETDGGLREAAARAYCQHASPEDGPNLFKMAEAESSDAIRNAAVEALARLKDPKAIPLLAAKIGHVFDGQSAEKYLRDFGSVAEKEVLKVAFDPEQHRRQAALRLLNSYGTKDAVLFDQALLEIQKDPKKRLGALEWLAGHPIDEARRAEVAKIVGPFIKDRDHGVGTNALKVFERFGTKEQVPLLIDVVKDTNIHQGDVRNQAIALLGKLKDPRAAPVLVDLLDESFFEQSAKNALEALGPAAESEVLPLLNHPRDDVRTRVRSLLKSYNTKDAALLDRTIEDLTSPEAQTRKAALEFLSLRKSADEAKRAEVAAALNVVLKDNDRWLVEAAMKAVEIWAAKENFETLQRIAADPGFFQMRGQAIDAIARVKDEATVPALMILLQLDDPKLAVRARDHLQLMGPTIEKQLIDLGLKSPNAKIRIHCWHVLTFVGTKDNLKDLKALAGKEVPPIKQIADTACKEIEKRP